MNEIIGADEIIGTDDEDLARLYAGDDDDDLYAGDDDDDDLVSGDVDIVGALGNLSSAANLAALARNPGGMVKGLVNIAKKAGKLQKAEVVRRMRRKHAVAVRPKKHTFSARSPMGFRQAAIAAGAAFTFQLGPSVPFKPRELKVKKDCASLFTISQLQIGQRSFLVSGFAVPAENFTTDSTIHEWDLPTIQISQPLIMQVTNVSLAAADFEATWFGRFVE